MSWIMKWLHLIFIAFVLCGDTNGFTVWNRAPVVGWQAGHSNTLWNQNDQLSTPVQPSKLLARRGANVNVKGGRFSSVPLASEIQTFQRNPSFVQSSGAAAHDVSILYAQNLGGPTVQQQDKLLPGPSRLYPFKTSHAENNGTLVSRSQSAANTNLVYGSQTQSSGQSMANPVIAGQFAAAQSLGASYQSQTSGRYPIFQGQVSTFPFRVSGFQTQLSYQPFSRPQPQTSGASTLHDSLNSGRYLTSLSPTIPISSQSAISTTLMPEIHTASSYQPSTATLVLAGQSAAAQAQSLGASHPTLMSGRYNILQGHLNPFSSQVSGFQTQSSYQPSIATQPLTGQLASTSQAQVSGVSMFNQGLTPGGYLTSIGQSVPSFSQSAVLPRPTSLFQASAYQPSTPPQIPTGQSLISQAPFSSRAESSENAKWYTIMHPQTISVSFPSVGTANWLSGFQTQSSNQPSSASQVLAGQSAVAQSLGASYPSQTSGGYATSQGPMSPSSQVAEFQTHSLYQPSTMPVSAGQSVSLAQSSDASMLNQGPTFGRYLTSVAHSIPSAASN